MNNDKGKKVIEAKPSYPVEVQGLSSIPDSGESFVVVEDERKARQISLFLQQKQKNIEMNKTSKISLEDLHEQIKQGDFEGSTPGSTSISSKRNSMFRSRQNLSRYAVFIS